MKRLVLLLLAVVLVGSACSSERPAAGDVGKGPSVRNDVPDAALGEDRKSETEPGLPSSRVRAENEPRHEWFGAPSEYREPERSSTTKSKSGSVPCRGNGILKLSGPRKSREGYGFFTIEYGFAPCVRELYINGEPAEPEPAPCAKYRLQAGSYTLNVEGNMSPDPSNRKYDIEKNYGLSIKEDQRVRFPFDWMDCLLGNCKRSHDCPELDEEMRRLWEENREVRELREKERRYQEARDRAMRRKQECSGD